MSIIEDGYTKALIRTLYNFYCDSIYDISAYLNCANIHFCDDINKDIHNFYSIKTFVSSKGITILPNEIIDEIHVLIDVSIETSEFYNIITLIHEFIHITDFIKYAEMYNGEKINGINKIESFSVYRLISEFHAYAKAEIISLGTCNEESIQLCKNYYRDNEEALLSKYLEKFLQDISSDHFQAASFASFLAKFYIFDYYAGRDHFEESCIHDFLTDLENEKKNFLLQLYQLFLSSFDDPFGALDQLSDFLDN